MDSFNSDDELGPEDEDEARAPFRNAGARAIQEMYAGWKTHRLAAKIRLRSTYDSAGVPKAVAHRAYAWNLYEAFCRIMNEK